MNNARHNAYCIRFNRTKWNALLQCICPQILGSIPPRIWRKYSAMPGALTHRLVWSTQSKKANPANLTVNPYYKENS